MNNSQYKKQVNEQLLSLGEKVNIYSDDSLPENYTIVLRLPPEISDKVWALSERIKQKYPQHFYYPKENYHMTLLGNIPKDSFSQEELIKIINQELTNEITIKLEGIGSSKSSVSVVGYPLNDSFFKFRSRLRKSTQSGDDYTTHHSVWENIAWVNFMRFKSQPGEDFFEFLYSFNNAVIGTVINPKIELYLNTSKTLDLLHCQLIVSF